MLVGKLSDNSSATTTNGFPPFTSYLTIDFPLKGYCKTNLLSVYYCY